MQLWRKGHATRLVSRWHDHVEDKWLTIALPAGFHADGSGGLSTGGHSLSSSSSSSSSSRDSNIAVLAQVEFQRGRQIDMANLVARGSREKEKEGGVGRKLGPVSIAFETVKGEFFFFVFLFFCVVRRWDRAWNECGDACANFNWGVDREDFAAALGGKDAEVGVTGMEDLIGFS